MKFWRPHVLPGIASYSARDRADGAPGYVIEVRVTHGRLDDGSIIAGADGNIGIELTAASGETPLTGLTEGDLLNERAAPDSAARHALAFLSYQEKFMAGSWRFNTYFGRDTLMSVRLLMPALRPAAIEAGLGSVLARMNASGEVAHEEGLSEFAILDRRKNGNAADDTLAADSPTLDFGMIDDDYMLAPVASAYLLEHASPEQARTFLAQPVASATTSGVREPAGTLLVRNLRHVVQQARPFANTRSATSLVPIKTGRLTGQWRDSEEGLGRGRYAYDVNAALVPAALEAIEKLLNAGLLDPYLSGNERTELGVSAALAQVWRNRAPGLFRVSIPSAEARERIQSYAVSLGVPAAPALAALGPASLDFHAIALDDAGKPIPIMNSDEGFALLFGHPSPTELETYVPAITRPFPAGLSDRHRTAGGKPCPDRSRSSEPIFSRSLSRNGSMVVATGAAGRRAGTATGTQRLAGQYALRIDPVAGRSVARDQRHRHDPKLGTLVVGVRQ